MPLGTLMQQPTLRKNNLYYIAPTLPFFFFCFRLKGKYKRLGRNNAHTSDVVQSHQGVKILLNVIGWFTSGLSSVPPI